MARTLAIALTVGSLVWVAALFAAAAFHGSAILPSLVYGASSLVCHQRPERSFVSSGVQFPVCARCAGLYVSGALGALFAWLSRRGAPGRSREVLLGAALPTLVTIPVEWLGMSPLSNVIRAVAAVPFGAAAGWTFVRALRSEATRRPRSSASVAL